MNKSVRMLVISLSLAALTSLSAPERQTFNPDEALGFLETIEQKKLCCTLKEMNISGGDLADIGISKGKRMGKALERILNDVIEEKTENEKNSLVSYARRLTEAGEI